ncbi:hypothetical protein M427DRAFT_496990 [Gonapodya prolifera JEL478]|uniref:Hemerythrin-like domain-containing protein n=1 Tax=Gonapodya prolifera (strain JEL478) TaxID=1344416 RepID=A0A139AGA7_GONPJ|nr:hypothetical protein M427DRAFT_496990 [Gonapodya prolifera JEL478]|eukprot:KXS15729.1 hypothetical protein M427DRAFT_496990 [Gonapodya prolifera JEL478]
MNRTHAVLLHRHVFGFVSKSPIIAWGFRAPVRCVSSQVSGADTVKRTLESFGGMENDVLDESDMRPIDDLIITDHKWLLSSTIRKLCQRFQNECDEDKKREILAKYTRLVSLHTTAEESVLYPKLEILAASGTPLDVVHLKEGHEKVREGLARAEEMIDVEHKGTRKSSVMEVLTKVMKELDAHMTTEERSDLVKLRSEVDEATRTTLGTEFRIAKAVG